MILSQPFPGYPSSGSILRFTFLAGFVVFLVLSLFKPFHIDTPQNHFAIWQAAVYGMGTFAAASLNAYLLPVLFRKFFREESWNVGKELVMMLWQITSISFVNLAITHLLYGSDFTLSNIIKFLGITAAVGIFPVTLIILLKQQILFRKYAAGAAVLEEHLHNKNIVAKPAETQPVQAPAMLTLTGDNQSEWLQLPITDVRFINAADNYIKVNYLEAGKPAQKVMRSTLKKTQAMLEAFPQLFRCHRAYIVNLAAVSHISGNAQGFTLHLCDTQEQIPVSRNLNSEITLLLSQYKVASR